MNSAVLGLLVFVTGGVGSVTRYVVGLALNRSSAEGGFPWGTLTVNLVGAFLITFIGTLIPMASGRQSDVMRVAVLTGFLGGFTTFSAIQLEFVTLLRSAPKIAWVYLGVTYVLGGLLAAVGWLLATKIVESNR